MKNSEPEDPLSYSIIGAAIDVQRYYGLGFLEAVYQDSLEIEFQERGIPYKREVRLPVYYGTRQIKSFYQADFICYDSIVVELKVLSAISGAVDSQILNYLKVTRMHKGLLLNFGILPLQVKRYAF